MSPGKDSIPPATGHTRRSYRADAFPPVMWFYVIGALSFVLGCLIVLVAQPGTPTASQTWNPIGFLFMTLGGFVFTAIPGALAALHHPWAGVTLQTLEERWNHPRLGGLAEVWLGVVAPGWLSVMILLRFPDALVPIAYAIFLVGVGPIVAIMFFDRRR